MNLAPLSTQYLRMGEALPFPLRDAGGRLLLAADVRMDDAKTFAALQPTTSPTSGAAAWDRR